MKTDGIFNEVHLSLDLEFDPVISDIHNCDNSNVMNFTIEHSSSLNVTKGHHGDVDSFRLSVNIPVKILDKLAVAWCKKRQLNANKYAIEELFSKDKFKWPVSEEELLEGLDEVIDNISL